MGCGMVRKVDELGRVVIPKEMRRILNIKTGSSIEMFINDDNQVVLKKFSELSNIILFAENLADIIFETFNLPCLVSDDEKIVVCKGLSKKDFLDKKIPQINLKNKDFLDIDISNETFNMLGCTHSHKCVFSIINEGFESGYVFIFSNEIINENIIKNVSLLCKFLGNLLKF